MTDKVQLIKEEIESYKESMKGLEPHSDFRRGQITAYNQIMQFIDSLPEEHNEDLENAAIAYSCANPSERSDGTYDQTDIEWAFEAGAEWQKKKDQETIELAEDHAMLAGMNKMKEEMMENAVDAFVHQGLYSKYVTECDDEALANALKNYNSGDKVKIIIIKPEQQ